MVEGLKALLNEALGFGGGRARVGGTTRLPVSSKADSLPSKGSGATGSDSLILSEPMKSLRDLGVDLEGSTFSESTQMLSFNLQFRDEQIRNLTSNGYYDFRSQSLQVDFSFYSALTVKDEATGEERQELFQFDFHLEASHVQTAWGNERVEKEDILHFARRILGKISKMHAEGKEIDGLALDTEDLKELASVDDGKLLKAIMGIIELMRNVDRLRGKHGDHVLLDLERGKALIREEGEKEERSTGMSLSVRRLSAEEVRTNSAEAPQAEDTSVPSPSEEQP